MTRGAPARFLIRAALATWLALAAAPPRAASALETDQFTVPTSPLADIGPELAAHVLREIDAAAARVNARAASHARAAATAKPGGFWQRHHRRAVEREMAEGRLALEVYRALAGIGLPECNVERWVRSHRFEAAPARFGTSCGASVYGPSPLARSPLIVSLSPTINVFGVYLGADKIGHVFQQGYDYYEVFLREEERHATAGDNGRALAAAVRRGIGQERGLYGFALVGVYSNADLAANYAGLKLYLNLTRPVRVGPSTRPPLFVRRSDRWEADARAWRTGAERAAAFFRPFISDHLNESLNPPRLSWPTRDTVRTRWRRRAPAWVTFYRSTPAMEAARVRRLATWHGEAYGHSGFDGVVTALDACFSVPASTASAKPASTASAFARAGRTRISPVEPAARKSP